MYRIINSLATAEYNREIKAVEVNFNGQGNSSLYHDTMDIAMNIAVVYNTNRWLFIKDLFFDIDVDNFVLFIRKWSKQCSEPLAPGGGRIVSHVALLTTADSYQQLLGQHEWLNESQTKFNDLCMRAFVDRTEAYHYLEGPVEEYLTV